MELIGIHSSVCETSLEQLEKQTSLANKIAVFIFSGTSIQRHFYSKIKILEIKKTSLGKWVPSRVLDAVSEVCPRLRPGAAEKV